MNFELTDINLDRNGNVLPPKTDKIALIDADTLVYTTCLNVQEEVEVMPKWCYKDEKEYFAAINDPTFDEEKGTYYEIDLYFAEQKLDEKIQRILNLTGCKTCELHFSDGKENFRYKFNPNYKANRKNIRRPAGLIELKMIALSKYNGFVHTKWEADDFVVFKKKENPDKYILVALDKDVLNAIEGKHFNYYENLNYNKKMHWVEVTKEHAIFWPYYQTIIGDKSDNIIGPSGIGPKRAMNFVKEGMTEKELWEGVVRAYKSKGLTEFDAIFNMNLINMNLLAKNNNGDIIVRKWMSTFDDKGNHIWQDK
jgi:5'-3' exonuclease